MPAGVSQLYKCFLKSGLTVNHDSPFTGQEMVLRASSDLTDPYERIKEALKQVCLTLRPAPVAQTPPIASWA